MFKPIAHLPVLQQPICARVAPSFSDVTRCDVITFFSNTTKEFLEMLLKLQKETGREIECAIYYDFQRFHDLDTESDSK